MDVKLEAYEGPLDLLLRLIQRSEIDIYNIPLTQITAEYIEVVSTLPPEMEQLSEFLVMAATLLEIKSNMLLPRLKIEGETEEDPCESLARQLAAYQQAQALAAKLGVLTPSGERFAGAGDKDAIIQLSDKMHSQPLMDLISISQLAEIFTDVMRRCAEKIDTVRADYGKMTKERFTVPEKVGFLRKALQKKGRLSLSSLFLRCNSRREMIVTFLALLEMMRIGMIFANQTKSFGDVEVFRCPA